MPSLQRDIFLSCAREWPIEDVREVFDAYMTSLFNAWLDNQNLYQGEKKAVVAFAAGFADEPGNVERFFDVYADGTFISVVRDPRGWFSSACRYKEKWRDVDTAVGRWAESTCAALAARERWGDAVLRFVTFEALVRRTAGVMERLAQRIGIVVTGSRLSDLQRHADAGGLEPSRSTVTVCSRTGPSLSPRSSMTTWSGSTKIWPAACTTARARRARRKARSRRVGARPRCRACRAGRRGRSCRCGGRTAAGARSPARPSRGGHPGHGAEASSSAAHAGTGPGRARRDAT